jgi:hypothetical protein
MDYNDYNDYEVAEPVVNIKEEPKWANENDYFVDNNDDYYDNDNDDNDNGDGDNDNELIFADYGGFVHVIKDGSELVNDIFPYETGDQIWGSVSSADIDLDGMYDFVVSSKSGSLYVFDINGLKFEYDSDRWLIATPVIGNIDDDEELEIIIGGYQSPTSSSPLFAINHDGSNVEGFPYIVGEKIKSGVALADMNGNGKDDIIFGTDGSLWILLPKSIGKPGATVKLSSRTYILSPSVPNMMSSLPLPFISARATPDLIFSPTI